ncbi:MAG TPA: hypothetical protein VK909_22820 [Anaerolineales bacterium]|nr:hypothetical protein [Anaerolineales bacterium]
MRLINLILAVLLLILIVIAVDPNARQKAVAFVNRLNNGVVVAAPSDNDSDEVVIVTATPSTAATAVANNNKTIPNTGDDETKEQPIIQINWTALGDALRKFWDELRNIRIEFRPNR